MDWTLLVACIALGISAITLIVVLIQLKKQCEANNLTSKGNSLTEKAIGVSEQSERWSRLSYQSQVEKGDYDRQQRIAEILDGTAKLRRDIKDRLEKFRKVWEQYVKGRDSNANGRINLVGIRPKEWAGEFEQIANSLLTAMPQKANDIAELQELLRTFDTMMIRGTIVEANEIRKIKEETICRAINLLESLMK